MKILKFFIYLTFQYKKWKFSKIFFFDIFQNYFSRQKIKKFRWDFFWSSSRDIGESIGSDSRQFPILWTLEFPRIKKFDTFCRYLSVTLDLTTMYVGPSVQRHCFHTDQFSYLSHNRHVWIRRFKIRSPAESSGRSVRTHTLRTKFGGSSPQVVTRFGFGSVTQSSVKKRRRRNFSQIIAIGKICDEFVEHIFRF